MRTHSLRLAAPLAALVLAVPLLAACAAGDPTVVALLVADRGADDSAVDVDAFRERVAETCEGCETAVYDAGGDADEQRSKARQALTSSADILVVEAIAPDGLEGLKLDEVPVVAVGEPAEGADRFVGIASGVPSTGSDPLLDQARDVVLGKAKSLTYVPMLAISEKAADVAVGLLADTPVDGGEEHLGVQSWLYEPAEVDLSNITTVLVGQGVITLEQLCDGETQARCRRNGLV